MSPSRTEENRAAWHAAHLSPLWESPNAHKPPPAPPESHQWSWSELRPLLERAFGETSPAAVERRVLQLMSPQSTSLADEFTVGNVLAAVQCLLPGESARPHRHPMNALRFMLEGTGAVTIVDGKECPMEFGDQADHLGGRQRLRRRYRRHPRILAERLQNHLQKPVAVENKPGVSGTLAAALVALAQADGHMLLVTSITLVTTPHVLAKAGAAPVDLLTDLAPVVQLTKGTLLVVANPARGIKDAKTLVGFARQKPDLSYGTPGSGSPMHIAGEAFKKAAGVSLTHVPYKGVAPALADLLGDHVTVVFSDLASANTYLQSGKLVAIGVTKAQRSPLLPDVPTLTEQGFPGVEFTTWFGVFAPAHTPAATLEKVNREINQVVAMPEVQRKFEALGEVSVDGTTRAFAERVKTDYEQFGKTVREFGIKAE